MENKKSSISRGARLAFPVMMCGYPLHDDNGRLLSPKRLALILAKNDLNNLEAWRRTTYEAMAKGMPEFPYVKFADGPILERTPFLQVCEILEKSGLSPDRAQYAARVALGLPMFPDGEPKTPADDIPEDLFKAPDYDDGLHGVYEKSLLRSTMDNIAHSSALHEWARNVYNGQHRTFEPQLKELIDEVKKLWKMVADLSTAHTAAQKRLEDLLAKKAVEPAGDLINFRAMSGHVLPDDTDPHLGLYDGDPCICWRMGSTWRIFDGVISDHAWDPPRENYKAVVWYKKISRP